MLIGSKTPQQLLSRMFDAWQAKDFEEMARYVQPTYVQILQAHEVDVVVRLESLFGLTTFGGYERQSVTQGLLKNMRDAVVELFDARVANVPVDRTVRVLVNVIEEPYAEGRRWFFNPVSALRREFSVKE